MVNIIDFKIKKIINSMLPLEDNILSINTISLEELLLIWESTTYEDSEFVTCRPIIKRNYNQAKDLFSSLMENDNVYIFGTYINHNNNLIAVGKVTISDYNYRNQSVEVGYTMLQQYRRCGYMYKSLLLIFKMLFTETPINKIYAQTGEFNEPSLKLLKSLKFHCDGRLRQHHLLKDVLYDDFIYSLTREDYNKFF